VIKPNLTGQNHTMIATTRTQNPNNNLRVCLLAFTKKLSVQLPKRIKANGGSHPSLTKTGVITNCTPPAGQ
jgi:hypothetical protein